MTTMNGLVLMPLLALFGAVVFAKLRSERSAEVADRQDDEPDMGALLDRIWSFQGGNEHEQVQRR